MKWNIPLFKIYWEKDDIKAITEIIKRGKYWATGKEIKEFEKKIARFVGTKYAISFNSGTSALHILLLAYNIKGKEVIVPSFTFIATANAVVLAEGKPVFAESENKTFSLDYNDVKSKITENTKAIITLHYGGFPSKDINKLRKLAKKKDLILIEDSAESLGASIGEKKVGSFGDSSIFSFCQNKIISTGEGGMIVTNSKVIYEKAKLMRSHGRIETSSDYFSSIKDNDYIEVGYNLRMSTMSAALGLSQLSKINKIIKIRRIHAKYLNKHLTKINEINIIKEIKGFYSVYQMYTIILKNNKIRNNLQDFLKEKKIMTKIYFNPIHLKTFYKKESGYKEGDLPKSEELSKKVLTLPLYVNLKKKELDYIISNIKKFFEK